MDCPRSIAPGISPEARRLPPRHVGGEGPPRSTSRAPSAVRGAAPAMAGNGHARPGGRRSSYLSSVSAGDAVPENFQVLLQPIHAFGRSCLGPGLEVSVPILLRVEDDRGGEGRDALVLLERHRLHGDVPGHGFELDGPGDPLRPHDLAELAAEPELHAVGTALHDPPRPTRPEVEVAGRDLVLPRAPPVGEVLARAVRLEDQVAGSLELPGEHGLPVGRGRHRHGATAWTHSPSPFLGPGAPPGTPRAGRSSPPRTAGTARSSPRPP